MVDMDTLETDTVTDTTTDTLVTLIADMDSMVTIMDSMAAIITDHSRRNWKISSPTPRLAKARRGFLFFVQVEFSLLQIVHL